MEYKRVIQEFPNGTNINLIPILTPEEEEKRHQRLNDAAVRLLLAQEKKDKEKQMKVATQEVAEGQAMKKKILEGAGMFFLAIGSCEQLVMFALIGFYLLYRTAKGEDYEDCSEDGDQPS